MTTYFDPTGTPGRKYGSTIVDVTAAGTTSGGATSIPAETGWTVALATNPNLGSNPAPGVKLPASAALGDVVEVWVVSTANPGSVRIFPPDGEGLQTGAASIDADKGGGHFFRKIAATSWGYLPG
jgi:hypothetical protein